MFLVDSHCHLDLLENVDEQGDAAIANYIERARKKDVQHILNVCVQLASFPTLLRTAQQYKGVSVSVGHHPNEPDDDQVNIETLVRLGSDQKVVAIGETGLDYYRTDEKTVWQQTRFRTHIQAAKTLQKPIIVHTRQAKDDTIAIMREEQANEISGVMHCFTEDWACAKNALDLNFYISFSGIVTFKNAIQIQEVAKKIPLDRILIETDAPYLAPVPYRGKPNEPGFVHYTAAFLAELRGESLDLFADATTRNFFKLFRGATP